MADPTVPYSLRQPPPRTLDGSYKVLEGKVGYYTGTGFWFACSTVAFVAASLGFPLMRAQFAFFGLLGMLIMGTLTFAHVREVGKLRRLWCRGIVTFGVCGDAKVREIKKHSILNIGVTYRDEHELVYEGRLIAPLSSKWRTPENGDTVVVVYLQEAPDTAAAFTNERHVETLTFGPDARRGVSAFKV